MRLEHRGSYLASDREQVGRLLRHAFALRLDSFPEARTALGDAERERFRREVELPPG